MADRIRLPMTLARGVRVASRARLVVGVCALVASALVGCAPERLPGEQLDEQTTAPVEAGELDPRPVATIDGRTLTIGEIERRLQQSSALARNLYGAPAQRSPFLEALLRIEVFALDALASGLGGAPEARILERVAVASGARLAGVIPPVEAPTDAEIAAYYEANPGWFRRSPRVALWVMSFDTPEQAAAFRDREGADWRGEELRRRTDLGRLTENPAMSRAELAKVFPPDVVDAAFATRDGGPVGDAWSCDGRTCVAVQVSVDPERDVALATATDAIRARIVAAQRSEREAAFLSEQRATLGVRVDDAALARLQDAWTARGGPTEPVRARFFDVHGLAGDEASVLGLDYAALLAREARVAPEGSGAAGDEGDGSGAGDGSGQRNSP